MPRLYFEIASSAIRKKFPNGPKRGIRMLQPDVPYTPEDIGKFVVGTYIKPNSPHFVTMCGTPDWDAWTNGTEGATTLCDALHLFADQEQAQSFIKEAAVCADVFQVALDESGDIELVNKTFVKRG